MLYSHPMRPEIKTNPGLKYGRPETPLPSWKILKKPSAGSRPCGWAVQRFGPQTILLRWSSCGREETPAPSIFGEILTFNPFPVAR